MYFQNWSSVVMRYAKHLHTRTSRANKATSATAQCSKIWVRISGGRLTIGQGGGGDPSVAGGAGGMLRVENEAIRSEIDDA